MKVILVCLALVGLGAAKLSPYIKTCSRDDPAFNKCFVEKANDAMATFTKGDDNFQTPAVAPVLKHPGAKCEPNDEFYFQIKETDVVGLDTIKLLDAKVDFEAKTIWFQFKYNVVDWTGTFIAKALKEKDEVAGKSHIVFTDNQYVFNMKYDVKDNHINIISLTTEYDGKPKIEYNLENMDKHPTVKALWEKHSAGFEKVCSDKLAEFFTAVLGQVFKAATYDEIFPPKQ